jgi:hypothetical protein
MGYSAITISPAFQPEEAKIAATQLYHHLSSRTWCHCAFMSGIAAGPKTQVTLVSRPDPIAPCECQRCSAHLHVRSQQLLSNEVTPFDVSANDWRDVAHWSKLWPTRNVQSAFLVHEIDGALWHTFEYQNGQETNFTIRSCRDEQSG